MKRSGSAVLVIAAALAIAGCGRGADQREVGAVTQRFLLAVGAERGPQACAQLSDATISQLESQEGKDCAQAVVGLMLGPSPVTRAQVYITSAKVDLADGQSAFLDRTPDGWKLSAVGCRVQGAKPADRPYDCELES